MEIVKYKYKSYSFPYVFLNYNQRFEYWSVTWINPVDFVNGNDLFMDKVNINTHANTPKESCKKALKFIKDNPQIFKK